MKGRKTVGLKTRTCGKTLSFLLIAGMAFLSGPTTASATEAQVVKIEPVIANGKLDRIRIDPQALTVKKGTIVIWLSGIDQGMVKLVFDDAAACQDMTADPKLTKFFSQWYDCYTTSYLPYGETTSLKFTQEGTFPYVVKAEDGKVVTRGKIVVTAR